MQKIQPKTQEEAREHALDWQVWQQDHAMYMSEVAEWSSHLEAIAEKFDLVDEFKENGII